jgi:hypothetical protein
VKYRKWCSYTRELPLPWKSYLSGTTSGKNGKPEATNEETGSCSGHYFLWNIPASLLVYCIIATAISQLMKK